MSHSQVLPKKHRVGGGCWQEARSFKQLAKLSELGWFLKRTMGVENWESSLSRVPYISSKNHPTKGNKFQALGRRNEESWSPGFLGLPSFRDAMGHVCHSEGWSAPVPKDGSLVSPKKTTKPKSFTPEYPLDPSQNALPNQFRHHSNKQI